MSNKLEEFVKERRGEFDAAEPSARLWQKIDTGIKAPAGISSKLGWLKYAAFGASVVTVIAYAGLRNSGPEQAAAGKAINSSEPMLTTQLAAQPEAIVEKQVNAQIPGNTVQVPVDSAAPMTAEMPPVQTDSLNRQAVLRTPDVTGINTPFRNRTENTAASTGTSQAEVPAGRQSTGSWQTKDTFLKVDTSFTGVQALQVNSNSFDVEVRTHDREQVLLKADATVEEKGIVKGKSDYKITYERLDSLLIVTVECVSKSRLVMGVSLQKALLDFTVPKTTNVNINSLYGDIKAEGLAGRFFSVKAGSGDIKMADISAQLKIESTHGDVTAVNIKGSVKAHLVSGDLSVSGLSGASEIKTVHGTQTFKNISGNMVTSCTSGDVKITGMKGDLQVAGVYGQIALEDYTGSPTISTNSGDITGKKVQLTGYTKLNSNHGSIKMDLVNNMDELSFELVTAHGQISIDKQGIKQTSESRLAIDKGVITIKGSTNSGDQSYK